jgi:hypothetical protein
LPRAAQWALAGAVAAAIWFGPPVLHTIFVVAAGLSVLLWGPQWVRLWLAAILGTLALLIGILLAIALSTS